MVRFLLLGFIDESLIYARRAQSGIDDPRVSFVCDTILHTEYHYMRKFLYSGIIFGSVRYDEVYVFNVATTVPGLVLNFCFVFRKRAGLKNHAKPSPELEKSRSIYCSIR